MSKKNREEGSPSTLGATRNQDELALHVLHSLDQPICILDAEDRLLFVNKAYATQYGIGFETLKGMPLRELAGEDFYMKRMKALLSRARDEGESEFRGWVEYPEGGRRFIEADIRLYTYPGLVDRKCLMIQHRDITDREALDRHRRQSLDFQEDLLRQIPALIWISGPDRQPYFYNDSWLGFTGSTLVEQIREGWMSMVHPDDRKMVEDRIQYAMANEEEVHLDFRLRHLMGGHRWVRLFGKPAVGMGGREGDFVASALDIDDNKTRELEMRTSLVEERHLREQALLQKAAADRANREKSAYLSLASHEIRTPMNPVIGFADLLASNPDLDGDSKEMAQMILKAGKNLLTLLDEVLDFAKIEAGVLKLSPEPVDLHDLLVEIENMYSFDAKSRGIDLRVTDRIKGDLELYQDRLRLQQVLGTLVSNAIKMTHTGHVEIVAHNEEIRLNGSQVQMLKLDVRDSGVGMDKEQLERLFKPFAHAETEFSDKYAGTGLGLAIAQKLVDAMGGTISVESKPGKGSTVHLSLPFEEVPRHLRRALKRRDGSGDSAEEEGRQAGIIIVDDEQSSRLVNASLMRFLGYESDVVANGEELLEKMRHNTYEMVLMDIMMPGIDGFEATRRIRNGECGEGNRESFIVAVTACAEEEDQKRGRKAGVNAYLSKPLTIDALRDTINRYHAMGRSI